MQKQIGPYRVLSELGAGGMGVTYRAFSELHGREVALKLARPGLAGPEECARLVREARLLAEIEHPHVVGFLDAGEHLGVPYLVMDLVEGEDLERRLRREGPCGPDDAARIVRQVAEGVGALHRRGVVHRDLKPANVLLDPRGSPRVCDLGIAGGDELSRLTETGVMLGTPAYLSPEQALGDPVGPPADVYALGAMLYALVSGRPPFEGASALAVLQAHAMTPAPPLAGAPPALARVVARCLAKDPGERYPDAGALAEALGRPGSAPPRRSRGALGALVLVVGVLAGALGAWGLGAGATSPVAVHLAAAEDALERDCLHEASLAYARALAEDPDSVDAHLGQGRLAARQEQLTLAREHLDRAHALDPSRYQALLSRSLVRLLQGDAQGAVEDLGAARALAPGEPAVEVCAAVHERHRGDVGAAQERLNALVARGVEPPNLAAEVQGLLGRVLLAAEEPRDALAAQERALALYPTAERLSEVILTRAFLGQPGQDAAVREAREAYPESQSIRRLEARLAANAGRGAEAYAILRELSEREPESLGIRLELASLRAALKRELDLAQLDLDRALAQAPTWSEAWGRKVLVAEARRDLEGACDAARRWAESLSPRAPMLTLEAWWLWAHRTGREAELREAQRLLWSRDPSAGYARRFAQAALARREADAALQWVERGLERFPGDETLKALGRVGAYLRRPTPKDAAALRAHIASDPDQEAVPATCLVLAREDWRELDPGLAQRWLSALRGEELDPWLDVARGLLALRALRAAAAEQRLEEALLERPREPLALRGLALLYAQFEGHYESGGLAALCALAGGGEERALGGGGAARAEGAAEARAAWALALPALRARARAAVADQDNRRAYVLGRTLAARAPRDPAGWEVLGVALARRQAYALGGHALRRAHLLDGDDPRILGRLASLALEAGDLGAADERLARLKALDPEGLPLRRCVVWRAVRGRDPRALELATALREDAPDDPDVAGAWALVLARSPGGPQRLEPVLDDLPAPGRGWLALADVARERGDLSGARDALLNAERLGGASPSFVARFRAEVEIERGDWVAAEAALAERALPSAPLNAGLWITLGRVREGRGDARGAYEAGLRGFSLSRTVQDSIAAAEVLVHSCRDLADVVDARETRRWAEALVDLEPKSALACEVMLELCLEAGEAAQAQRWARALERAREPSEAQRERAAEVLAR